MLSSISTYIYKKKKSVTDAYMLKTKSSHLYEHVMSVVLEKEFVLVYLCVDRTNRRNH